MRRAALLLALLLSPPVHAQSPWDPLFLGYGTEPEMDYGGRMVMSLQSAVSRGFGSIAGVGERHPGLAPAWEFPVGAAVLLIQHEVDGHGGRAREFGLSPSYAFHFDFSAATGTRRPPPPPGARPGPTGGPSRAPPPAPGPTRGGPPGPCSPFYAPGGRTAPGA